MVMHCNQIRPVGTAIQGHFSDMADVLSRCASEAIMHMHGPLGKEDG